MNKKIYNEDLILNLIVNGDKVQPGSQKLLKDLYELDQATRKLQLRNAALELEKKQLDKTSAGYAQRLAQINAQISANTTRIDANQKAMQKLRMEIGVAGMTLNQLNSYLKVLKVQLANATDPKIISGLRNEIQEVEIRLTQITTGAGRLSQAWTRLARDANKYSAAIGWISITAFMVGSAIGGLVERLGGLDRKLSEVMKTTGLTREEAMRLKREYDTMPTPTKTDDLLDMAKIAGRLGIEGYDNIKRFTSAVDVLYTALGDDLNLSVSDTAEKVGKLVNAFRVTDKMPLDDALLRTGSLLNELDKSSVASAGTILEYMTRLSSLGTTANYPIDKIAGLAAAMETVNIPAERGATALRNIINGLGKYSERFSRILGMSLGDFKQAVETDINDVFLKLIELTSKGDKSIVDMVGSMGDMEISGVRVQEVYSAIAQNIDVIQKQQEIAGRAFQSNASVLSEYNIITKDFQGSIDLQSKRVRSLADDFDLKLRPSVFNVYKFFIDFLYVLKDLANYLYVHSNNVKGLVMLYAAWKSTAIAEWLTGIGKSIYNYTLALWNNSKAVITHNSILVAWQTHGIRGAMVALKQLWATLLTNPLGVVIGTISALVGAMFLLAGKTDIVKETMLDMQKDMLQQKGQMEQLFDAAERSAIGTDKHRAAIKALNEIYGKYLPNQLSEKDNLDKITEARKAAIGALEKEIALKWQNEQFAKIEEDNIEQRKKAAERLLQNLNGRELGAASRELDELTDKIFKGQANGNEFILGKQFLEDYKRSDQESRDAMRDYIELLIQMREEKQKLDAFVQGYTGSGNSSKSSSNIPGINLKQQNPAPMTEDEFNALVKDADKMNKYRTIELNDRKLSEAEYQKQSLNNEMNYVDQLIGIHERYNAQDTKDLDDLRLRKSEITRKIYEESLKETKKADKAMFDMEKIRMEAMEEGRDKELAEEMVRHDKQVKEYKESGNKQAEIDEAVALEHERHMNNVYAIYLKYTDKELENETIAFAERMTLLEKQYKNGEIKENDYLERKKALQEDYQKSLVRWNKKNGDVDSDAMDAEIEQVKLQGQRLGVTEEEIQQHILEIRKKYAQKREHEAETNAQRELRILKEQFSKEQMDAFAQGEFVVGLASKIGEGVGNALGMLFDSSQKTNEAILKGLIEMVLDAAHSAILAWEGVILAREIATKGFLGIPTAATYIGMIELAYGVAKAALSAWNTSKDKSSTGTAQHYAGKYPVLGADDRMTYWAEWRGNAQTGVYGSPALIAERGPEMVIDYPTLRNMKMNAPGLIQAIMAMRVPQYAKGKYLESGEWKMENGKQGTRRPIIAQNSIDPEMRAIMSEVRDLLKKPIRATFPRFGTNSLSEAIEDRDKFYSKIGR